MYKIVKNEKEKLYSNRSEGHMAYYTKNHAIFTSGNLSIVHYNVEHRDFDKQK